MNAARLFPVIAIAGLVMILSAGCATMVNKRQMTLDDIVSMSQAGAGDAVIERQISATNSEFVLTPEDISNLKKAGVSDDVIETMIRTSETPRYFDYEYPYYGYHYYGYYPRYVPYRRSDLLGRFYFYGPPYPYPYSSYGDYERWRRQVEEEYNNPRRGNTGNPDLNRRGPSNQDEDQ